MDRGNISDALWLIVFAVFAPIWIPIAVLVVLVYGGCYCSKNKKDESDDDDGFALI